MMVAPKFLHSSNGVHMCMYVLKATWVIFCTCQPFPSSQHCRRIWHFGSSQGCSRPVLLNWPTRLSPLRKQGSLKLLRNAAASEWQYVGCLAVYHEPIYLMRRRGGCYTKPMSIGLQVQAATPKFTNPSSCGNRRP